MTHRGGFHLPLKWLCYSCNYITLWSTHWNISHISIHCKPSILAQPSREGKGKGNQFTRNQLAAHWSVITRLPNPAASSQSTVLSTAYSSSTLSRVWLTSREPSLYYAISVISQQHEMVEGAFPPQIKFRR